MQLTVADLWPDDKIAASATPREASLIAATIRDYDTRGC
jgi:hypothetical protein